MGSEQLQGKIKNPSYLLVTRRTHLRAVAKAVLNNVPLNKPPYWSKVCVEGLLPVKLRFNFVRTLCFEILHVCLCSKPFVFGFLVGKLAEKRANVAKEILGTERNYLARLHVIVDVFKTPLEERVEQQNAMLNKANIRSIFSDLEIIIALNEALLKQLVERVSNYTHTTKIGDVFVTMGQFFRWYQSYVSNYDKAFATLKTLKRNPEFKAFLAVRAGFSEFCTKCLEGG
jgi:nitrogen regulatory protein PII